MQIPLFELSILLPAYLFILGLTGLILWKKNLIALLISIEIMFLATNIGFVLASLQIDDGGGLIFSIIILALAGVEISIGLALIIIIYRRYFSIWLYATRRIKH